MVTAAAAVVEYSSKDRVSSVAHGECLATRDNRIDNCGLAASPAVIATSCELVFALFFVVLVSVGAACSRAHVCVCVHHHGNSVR
eukprot:10992-Heterococcus_DN1.PRE.7